VYIDQFYGEPIATRQFIVHRCPCPWCMRAVPVGGRHAMCGPSMCVHTTNKRARVACVCVWLLGLDHRAFVRSFDWQMTTRTPCRNGTDFLLISAFRRLVAQSRCPNRVWTARRHPWDKKTVLLSACCCSWRKYDRKPTRVCVWHCGLPVCTAAQHCARPAEPYVSIWVGNYSVHPWWSV